MGNVAFIWARRSLSERWNEWEQQTASRLVVPGVKYGVKSKFAAWCSWARQWREKVGAAWEVVDPHCIHNTAAVLSRTMSMFACDMGVCDAVSMPPKIRAASSKSLFITVPMGVSVGGCNEEATHALL
jgi:hypothetical protein